MSIVLAIFSKLGYFGVMILMAIESSFLPMPSEVVIPPAAVLAQRGEMNLWLIIIAGTIGSMIGALFNYFLSLKLGRPLVYKLASHRYARFFLLSEKKLKKAEDFFLKYSDISTFVGRLFPVIRHLISIPAGFSRMSLKSFILLTFIGSLIWCTFLGLIGYYAYAYIGILSENLHIIAWLILFVIIAWVAVYWFKENK